MKLFKEYITELFDRKVEYRQTVQDNGLWGYNFIFIDEGDGLKPAPRGKDLERYVDKTTSPNSTPGQKIQEFNNRVKVYSYIVNFDDISKSYIKTEYSELALISNVDIFDRVWELSFDMRKSELDLMKGGRPSITGKYYYSWDVGTDEDINIFSGANAAMILGAVRDIAKDFVEKKKPRGIILGTKLTANPARGRIYKNLARIAARETGGELHELDFAREGMKNGAMVWFDTKNPFNLPYQKA